MAFRMSDRDKAAIQAAAAIRQSNQAQADYDALMPQAMAKINQAQQGPSNPLESVLSGIGNSIKNVGTGLMDLFGTGGAAVGDAIESIRTGKATTKNQDDYRKWLYNTDSVKDAATKGLGTGLDAAATLTDFIPGLGTATKVGLNIGQGVASGIANPLIEKGSQATLEDAMKGALVGGASAGVGQYVGGKLANRAAGKGLISKALNSNVGKGAITGGLAGATGGGLYAGLNGGDVLQGALQGAQGGAMAGGTMAGTMGILGSGIDRLNRKYNATPQTPDIPATKPIVDEVAEQYTKPATIETALQEAQTPTRRQIDVQYDGSGNGNVAVNRQRRNMYRLPDRSGSTLDGILGPNNKLQLPNAQRPTNPYAKMTDIEVLNDISPSESGVAYKNLADAIQSGDFLGNDPKGVMAFLKEELPKETYDNIQNAIQDRVDLDNMWAGEAYGVSKGELPYLNRDEYYRDTIGRLGNKGNGNLRAEDVPESMYNRLRNSAGKNSLGGNMTDNESILRELFGNAAEGKDKYELYDMYQQVAEAPGPRTYNMDDITAAVTNSEYNNNLGDQALNAIVAPFRQEAQPTSRQIGVQGAPSIADSIDVSSPNRGQLIQDVMPAQRRQAQPQVQAQPIQEVPTPAPVQRVAQNGPSASDARTKAYDWRGDSLSGAGKKRNYLQVIGGNLQDTAQVTRDAAVYGKLKGNTADEMIRKGAVDNLRNNYGYSPDDYKQAAAVSTAVNKWYDNEIKTSGATANIQDLGKRLRGVGRTDYILPEKYEKVFAEEIGSALSQANVHDSKTMTMYSADGLEKAAKYLEQKEQKLRRTSHGGSKAAQGTIDPNDGKLADRYREARLILRDEINNMIDLDDITRKNLSKVLDDLGATDAAKQRILSANNFAEVKAATSPLEDARTMYNQMRSSGMKRGANADNSTSVGTQLVSKTGMSGVIDALGKPIRDSAATAEKLAGKAISAVGDVVSGKDISGKAGKVAGKAAEMLNNDTFSGREISPITRQGQTQTIGDVAMRQLSRQAGLGAMQQQDRQNAIQNATQEAQDVQSNYENSMLQAQQAYNQAQQAQQAIPSTLDRIGAGMERALAAGDIDAYSTLANLYKQAAQMYELQNPTTTKSEAKALSANQSKAMAGLQQLQDLRGMQPGVRTALANSPLAGLVDMTGGDDYTNQAKSLALTLGYLQSGANITPREAENIGRAYIPSAYDSESVRQNKLSRAEQLLRNYLADTSALQQ